MSSSRPFHVPARRLFVAAALVAAVSAVGSGVATASTSGPRKAAAPAITVSPSKNLHNKEKVEITGKNFPPKTGLVIVQCNPKVLKNNPSACDASHLASVTTTSKGTISKTAFVLVAGTVGNGKCGTAAKNLTCYIFVSKPSVTSTVHADAKIVFKKP